MGAPEGNNFWTLRSRHGRNRLFESPQELWDAACEYFEWCEANPLYELKEYRYEKDENDKEKRIPVKFPKVRAFTMQGLTRYLDCNTVYFNHFEMSIKGKEDEKSKDFSKVITLIRETVYEQKFTHAAAGFLNANLISRDLGLKDSSEITGANGAPLMTPQPQVIIQQVTGLPPLSTSESDIELKSNDRNIQDNQSVG